jgi:hypothetical protein
LPVVLYGTESWSLALREECRLRVFENRRTIFGPKKVEVTGVEDILLSTLFSKTPSLHFSLNVSDQVSQRYKTTGKIIVLYIIISTLFYIKLEDKRVCTE